LTQPPSRRELPFCPIKPTALLIAAIAPLTPFASDEKPLTQFIARDAEPIIGTTENTVKVHRSRAMEKMQAKSLADLVKMVERLKISPEKAS